MKIDKEGKRIARWGMQTFLMMVAFFWGAISDPWATTSTGGDKTFVIMFCFCFTVLFGAMAYLTEEEE